jgi:hypothetical protein
VFELPDCSLLQLLGRQQLRTRQGHSVESFLFQKTFPGALLAPSDVYRGIGAWRRQLVVTSGWLPLPLVDALLRCGARGVVCAESAAAAAAADGGELAALLELLLPRLAGGQGVEGALADCGALLPGAAGLLSLYQA